VFSPARASVTFVGLTVINPTTVIYFVELVVGLRSSSSLTASDSLLNGAKTHVHGVGGLSQPNRIRSQPREQERIRCNGG